MLLNREGPPDSRKCAAWPPVRKIHAGSLDKLSICTKIMKEVNTHRLPTRVALLLYRIFLLLPYLICEIFDRWPTTSCGLLDRTRGLRLGWRRSLFLTGRAESEWSLRRRRRGGCVVDRELAVARAVLPGLLGFRVGISLSGESGMVGFRIDFGNAAI